MDIDAESVDQQNQVQVERITDAKKLVKEYTAHPSL